MKLPNLSPARLYLAVTCVVAVGMVAGALLEWLPADPSPWRWLPLGVAYLVGGAPILRDTLETLKEGRLSIDFLMGAAALGAASVGQPLEGVILIFLFSLSNALEALAMGRTRDAIGALMKLHPEEATLLDDDGNEVGGIPVDRLVPGQRVRVRPGERLPADGVVTEGRSEVDQSAITGESVPVSRADGDEVFAGTINGSGTLVVEVRRHAGDTMLARIVRLVEEAREQRAPAQEFIDRFAHPYTLAVLGGSAATALVTWLAFGFAPADAVYRAMTVLVVASPCALVISTPSAILSGIANGARRGVLFKGGAYLDLAGSVDAVAFDKTGTLTVGRPLLLDRLALEPDTDSGELLRLAAVLEFPSEHHLARAVVEAARAQGVITGTPPGPNAFVALPGRGITGEVEGRSLWMGNEGLATDEGASISPDTTRWLADQRARGRSAILLGEGPRVLAAFSFGDALKPGAAQALRRLREDGIRSITILSGDHPEAVETIARELGADEVRAGLLPDEKVRAVEELRRRHGGVAMIGDGVNDAPAMATATLGVAMGAAGTDVAIETADVVLMGDEVDRIPWLLTLGRRARRVVRQNVYFSVGWMALLVVVATTVGMPLTLAVVAHEGSTLLVVVNGLRLLRGS